MRNVFLAIVVLGSTVGLRSAGSAADDSATLQPLLNATSWINGKVTPPDLRGKVVLVDIFTIECINCIDVTPNLRSLEKNRGSRGLAIVGIHTPETRFQHDRATVEANIAKLGVTWPIAVDNDYSLWNAYRATAWPTQLIFDRRGRLRETIVGDSQDAKVDDTIDRLLQERATKTGGS